MNKSGLQIGRILLTLLAMAGVGYLLWMIRFTIVYILISAVIAIIGKPLVDILTGDRWKKLKLNRNLAAAVTLLIIVGTLSGILSFFVPALIKEFAVLGEIDTRELFAEFETNLTAFDNLLKDRHIETGEGGTMLKDAALNAFDIQNITGTFQSLAGGLGNLLFALFSVLFITFFFLREKHLFRSIVLAFVPDKYEGQVRNLSPNLKHTLSRYFIGLLIQITIITTLISLGLKFIGFHNTIVIGLFAGLINVIPYIGPIIGMAFGLILGMAQSYAGVFTADPSTLALMIVGVFGAVQMIDNFVLQPVIFSNSINAHPLEIFLVISIAASISGISGMIIAVPTYSVLRLLAGEFFPNVKFIRQLTQKNKASEAKQSAASG